MLFFKKYGSGDKNLLAFHGFGGTHKDFEVFLPALSEYTVYSFDLWHHGQSEYDGQPLDRNAFQQKFQAFLAKHKLFRFSLMGYSLGGRICLELIETFPGKIDEVFLFAPDGLRRNLLYRFSTRTLLGNYLFRRVNQDAGIFFKGAEFFARIGVLDSKIKDFVIKQMGTKEKREKVYKTWRTTSRLWPNLKQVAENIVRYKMKLTIVMGEKDKVIKKEWARKLTRYLPDNVEFLKVVDAGHKLQTEEVRKEIWGI
jgi:pimeloyl-ACP methyl ester carboxylesterase